MSLKNYCFVPHHNICIYDEGHISLDDTIHMMQRHVLLEHGEKHFSVVQ